MICVYNENCASAGRRAYHQDEDERKRTCDHGDHTRVGQSRKDVRAWEWWARQANGTPLGVYFSKVAKSIKAAL